MKYLVNRETKEHIRFYDLPGDYYNPESWRAVDADDEGWIRWSGGECPLPLKSLVGVQHKSGDRFTCGAGYDYAEYWGHTNCGGDITAYRPILPAESKPTLEETWHAIKRDSKVDVFTRLSAAVSASEQIPALIAEINAMLPDGYEVREKAKTEQPAEDMSDWRNWRAGDIVLCISQPAEHGPRWFTVGDLYAIHSITEVRPRMMCNRPTHLSNDPKDFKFHSRPVTK